MTNNSAGGSRCPPILSREEIARRRREDEQRRLRVPVSTYSQPVERFQFVGEPTEWPDVSKPTFTRQRKGRH